MSLPDGSTDALLIVMRPSSQYQKIALSVGVLSPSVGSLEIFDLDRLLTVVLPRGPCCLSTSLSLSLLGPQSLHGSVSTNLLIALVPLCPQFRQRIKFSTLTWEIFLHETGDLSVSPLPSRPVPTSYVKDAPLLEAYD